MEDQRPETPNRPFQFSLSSVLLLTAVFAVFFALPIKWTLPTKWTIYHASFAITVASAIALGRASWKFGPRWRAGLAYLAIGVAILGVAHVVPRFLSRDSWMFYAAIMGLPFVGSGIVLTIDAWVRGEPDKL